MMWTGLGESPCRHPWPRTTAKIASPAPPHASRLTPTQAWVDQQEAADAAGRHGHFRLVEELPDELLLHMLHILNLSDFELGESSRDSPPLAVLRGAHTESRLACRRLRDACSELRTAAEASLSAECASWVRDIGYSGYRPHWSDWFSLWGDGPLADVLLAWRD